MKMLRPAKSILARRLALALGIVLPLAVAAPVRAQSLKVGTVNVAKIFNSYYRTREIEKSMKTTREGAKQEFDERLEKRKQAMEAVSSLDKIAENQSLSASARGDLQKQREEKIGQVRELERELNEYKNTREKTLQETAVRLRSQIIEEIVTVIDARVQSEHYDLVLNSSGQGAQGTPIVLHGNDKLDFTNDVLAILNKDHPEAAKPEPSPAASPGAAPAK